jgi:hypothetical protein
MRRKNGIRTLPWPVATAESPGLPPLPPPEDEDPPAAKKPRLQAPARNYTAANGVTPDSPCDTPTDPVTPAASLPSAASRRRWNTEEDAKLTEAVKKYGNQWGAVAKLVLGRTNRQCRHRWVITLDHTNGGYKSTTPRSWEPEEGAKLTEAVKKYGKVWYWTAIAAMVPGRNDQQCRKRWLKRLDPDRTANTVEDDPERR